jgi:hypothetical protein
MASIAALTEPDLVNREDFSKLTATVEQLAMNHWETQQRT